VLDESYRQRAITVGGFLAGSVELPSLAASWRELKIEMGLDVGDELKYEIPQQHPSRARLDAAGWSQRNRVPRMLEWIADQPVTIITDTLVDWRQSQTGTIQQLYFHAFDWCLRRAANHVQIDLQRPPGPHTVLVDMPGSTGVVDDADQTALLRLLQDNRGTAAFAHYRARYLEPESWPSGLSGEPLGSLGFHSELHASHAKHSDLLQIADVVAGCINDLCEFNLQSYSAGGALPSPDYQESNFLLIADRFRTSREGRIIGYGLDVFPRDDAAAEALLSRIEDL